MLLDATDHFSTDPPVYPFKEALNKSKIIPQRLKPHLFGVCYGTAEAVPLQNANLIRDSLIPIPVSGFVSITFVPAAPLLSLARLLHLSYAGNGETLS
jgi:hypothetical protein